MRKRLVFAVLCILALPLLFSLPQNGKKTNPAPFATVALAGRTLAGSYCTCGCPACICDDGERPEMCLQRKGAVTDAGKSFGQVAAPVAGKPEMMDFGSG